MYSPRLERYILESIFLFEKPNNNGGDYYARADDYKRK